MNSLAVCLPPALRVLLINKGCSTVEGQSDYLVQLSISRRHSAVTGSSVSRQHGQYRRSVFTDSTFTCS